MQVKSAVPVRPLPASFSGLAASEKGGGHGRSSQDTGFQTARTTDGLLGSGEVNPCDTDLRTAKTTDSLVESSEVNSHDTDFQTAKITDSLVGFCEVSPGDTGIQTASDDSF